jgi:hypothetical protein
VLSTAGALQSDTVDPEQFFMAAAHELLQETLQEEEETDETLTDLAESINVNAAETIGDDPEDKSLLEKVKAKATGKS